MRGSAARPLSAFASPEGSAPEVKAFRVEGWVEEVTSRLNLLFERQNNFFSRFERRQHSVHCRARLQHEFTFRAENLLH